MNESQHPQAVAAGPEPRRFFSRVRDAVQWEASDFPLLAITLIVPLLPTMVKGLALRIIALQVMVFVALLLLPLGKGGFHGRLRSAATPLDKCFLIWLAVVLAGLLLAPNPEYASYKMGYILSLIVLFYCFTTRIKTYPKALVFVGGAMGSAFLASVLELAFSPWLGKAITGDLFHQSLVGSVLYIHPYLAAQYFLPVCIMALALVLNRGAMALRVLAALTAFPILIYVFIVGSRGAYLAFLLGSGLVLILVVLRFSQGKGSARVRKVIWIGLPVLFLVFAAIFILSASGLLGAPGIKALARIFSLFNPQLADFNFARLWIWRDAFEMSSDSLLLGFGQGNFSLVFPTYHMEVKDVPHAHNQFLQILCENGILGLLCFLAVIVQLFFLMRRVKGNYITDDLGFSLQTGATGALAAAGIYCFFETPLEWPASAAFILLPISILLIPVTGDNGKEPGKRRWPWMVLAPLALLLWFQPGTGLIRAVQSGIHGDEGMRLLQEGKAEEATQAFNAAVDAWPCRPKIYYWQAHAYLKSGKVEEALEAAKRSLEIQPGVSVTQAICGYCLFRLGRFEEAKDYYKASLLRSNPMRSKTTYFILGKSYRRSGSLEAALVIFQKLHQMGYHYFAGAELFLEMSRTLVELEREPSLILNLLFKAREKSAENARDLIEIQKIALEFEKRFHVKGNIEKQLRKLKRQTERLLKKM